MKKRAGLEVNRSSGEGENRVSSVTAADMLYKWISE
jgi:hypothetical protein